MKTAQEILTKIDELKKLIDINKEQITEDKTIHKLLALQDLIHLHESNINQLEWVLEIPMEDWFDADLIF